MLVAGEMSTSYDDTKRGPDAVLVARCREGLGDGRERLESEVGAVLCESYESSLCRVDVLLIRMGSVLFLCIERPIMLICGGD